MAFKLPVDREALLKAITTVKPALSSQSYIKALTHILFNGSYAIAFNDIAAIAVKCPTKFKCCLPGDLLARTVSNFSKGLEYRTHDEETFEFISGRSIIKLPSLPVHKFPFQMPGADLAGIRLSKEVMKALSLCRISVGTDKRDPGQLGITLDVTDDGYAILFSTDSATISSYRTDLKINLPDGPVLLPVFFCEQLRSLSKTFDGEEINLFIGDGYLIVDFGNEATLFTKTVADLRAMDYQSEINRHCKINQLPAKSAPIPDGFEDAMERAVMVIAGDKRSSTAFDVIDGVMAISTKSEMGVAEDELKFDGDDFGDTVFNVAPKHIIRVSKHASHMCLLPRVLVLSDEKFQFVHLIAHISQ